MAIDDVWNLCSEEREDGEKYGRDPAQGAEIGGGHDVARGWGRQAARQGGTPVLSVMEIHVERARSSCGIKLGRAEMGAVKMLRLSQDPGGFSAAATS